MKSITELSKIINFNVSDLNRMLVKNHINVATRFGVDDGFISQDIYDFIIEEYEEVISDAFSLEEVIANRSVQLPIKPASYIYFLLDDNEIIYIGQSSSLLGRIGNHQDSKKQFSHVSVFEVKEHRLDDIEELHIWEFDPPLNMTKNNNEGIIRRIIRRY